MIRRKLSFLFIILGMMACSSLNAGDPPVEKVSGALESEPNMVEEATAKIESTPSYIELPVIGPAPEWDNETWINSEGPLELADLRGKVVLLEFWTFG